MTLVVPSLISPANAHRRTYRMAHTFFQNHPYTVAFLNGMLTASVWTTFYIGLGVTLVALSVQLYR